MREFREMARGTLLRPSLAPDHPSPQAIHPAAVTALRARCGSATTHPSRLPCEPTDGRPALSRGSCPCLSTNDPANLPHEIPVKRCGDRVRRRKKGVPVALDSVLTLLGQNRPNLVA